MASLSIDFVKARTSLVSCNAERMRYVRSRAVSQNCPTLYHERRDAADAAWDEWYALAKSFALGELSSGPATMADASAAFLKTLLLAWQGAPDRYFTGSVSDDYTIE